jgi:transposase
MAAAGTGRIVRFEGKMNRAECSEPQTGAKVHLPAEQRHTVKTMQEWLRDKFLNVLEWPSQSPDLSPIKHLWRDLKIAVQRRSSSNLTELERIGRTSPNTGVPSL